MKNLSQLLRSCDKFGKSVEVNYRGKTSYKTKYGGFTSIISTIAVLGYAVHRLVLMISKESQNTST